MADLKISGLSADASPTSDDLIVTVNDPSGTPGNKKVTLANLKTFVNTAPTISDYTNAAHDHGDADDGGVLVAGAMPALTGDVTTSAGAVATTRVMKNSFSVYRNGALTVNTGADRQITYETEVYDIGANFASSLFTAPLTGYWQFSAFCRNPATTSHTRSILRLYKNGSNAYELDDRSIPGIASGCGGSVTMALTSGDTVGIYVQPIGANVALTVGATGQWFTGTYIGQ